MTLVKNIGSINLIDSMGDDLRIVNAARKSFGKGSKTFTDKDRKLLRYLWENDHTSPFEMVEFMFEVEAPLFVVRQWQRHRTWSFNEVSRRYTSENIKFFYPNQFVNTPLRKQSNNNKQSSYGEIEPELGLALESEISNLTKIAYKTYVDLLKYGVCREQARMILPQNMMVEFVAKVDLHNLLRFLKLRLHEHTQEEMREFAKKIVILIKPIVPETMKLFEEG